MEYAPGREPCPLPVSPFKPRTVPRPIGWLSTVGADGRLDVPKMQPQARRGCYDDTAARRLRHARRGGCRDERKTINQSNKED